jgi:hypothetical protein
MDPCHMCFACSLEKVCSIFSLLFAPFHSQFFASLQLSYFRFEAKRRANLFFTSKESSSSTLIHIFKLVLTDTPEQAYIYRLVRSSLVDEI